MKKHFIGGTLADFTWDLSKISMSDSHVSYANFDVWVIILNVWKVLIKILEGTFCQTINQKWKYFWILNVKYTYVFETYISLLTYYSFERKTEKTWWLYAKKTSKTLFKTKFWNL